MNPVISMTSESRGTSACPGLLSVGRHRGREPQKWWVDLLTLHGGRNRFGAPNIRIVWSEDRMNLESGVWRDFDAHGNLLREQFVVRNEPRYAWIEEKWILEAWVAPERYGSPDDFLLSHSEWYRGQRVPTAPVYPVLGDYEWAATIAKDGRYVEPNEQSLLYACYFTQHWKRATLQERLIEKREAALKEDADYTSWGCDVVDDARGPFYGQFVSMAGLEAPRRSTP